MTALPAAMTSLPPADPSVPMLDARDLSVSFALGSAIAGQAPARGAGLARRRRR